MVLFVYSCPVLTLVIFCGFMFLEGFYSASHMRAAAFLRCRVKLKDVTNVSSKAVDRSEELGGGASFCLQYRARKNVKIPGSPSDRYSSDFGCLKMYLTSPNKNIYIF